VLAPPRVGETAGINMDRINYVTATLCIAKLTYAVCCRPQQRSLTYRKKLEQYIHL